MSSWIWVEGLSTNCLPLTLSYFPLSGILLGLPPAALQRIKVDELFGMKAKTLLSLSDGRRGGIKTDNSVSSRLGPVHKVSARHVDGEPVHLCVQAVSKQGSR